MTNTEIVKAYVAQLEQEIRDLKKVIAKLKSQKKIN